MYCSVGAVREDEVDGTKKMDRGQRPEMPRSHPRSMDHTRGSSNLMPRSRREGLLNHGLGGWGLLGASPRKTRAPKRGALEIDPLGRGSPKYSLGGVGWTRSPPRKTRATKRGALEIDPLGRGSPKL